MLKNNLMKIQTIIILPFLIFISCNNNRNQNSKIDASCALSLETSVNKIFNNAEVANYFKSRDSVHLEIPYMSDSLTFKNFNGTVISLNNKVSTENVFKSIYYTQCNDYSILVFNNSVENAELHAIIKCSKDSVFVDRWNIIER